MRIQFWGTRGSIAKPGPTTIRFGGNTSCVSLITRDGTRIIFDCGTGAHGLGHALIASGEKPIRAHLLIGHTHWDHIQGLPSFAPLYTPGNEFDIYAPRGLGARLQKTLAAQMQYTYFPVSLDQLGAVIRYHDLDEETFRIGSVIVRPHYLNHTAVTLGYRVEADGVAVVYATDHEPHARSVGNALAARGLFHPEDRRHAAFMGGADLVIHDAQYTAAEYPAKIGWGHSTVDYAAEVARAAGARRVALFHHDPMRSDDALDDLVGSMQRTLRDGGADLELFAAAEGQALELVGEAWPEEPAPTPLAPEAFEVPGAVAAARKSLVIAVGEAKMAEELTEALRRDGFDILAAHDAETVWHLVDQQRPALMLLAWDCADWDASGFLERLRAVPDAAMRDLPVVVVASCEESEHVERAFAAGATDWLTWPCSQAFIQARVRAWLLRTRVRWRKPPLAANEAERIDEVRALNLLDTPLDERFDRLARIAAVTMGASHAFLSLIDAERQWFKSSVGIERLTEIPRDISMCAYTVLGDDVLVVQDASADERFGDNPAFHNELHLRFYAGVPLHGPGGRVVGALCVYDPHPRQPELRELSAFKDLAAIAEGELAAAARATPQPRTGDLAGTGRPGS